jgi:hypothetical protein
VSLWMRRSEQNEGVVFAPAYLPTYMR